MTLSTVTYTPPEQSILLTTVNRHKLDVEAIIIDSDEMANEANEALGRIKVLITGWEEQQKGILKPLAEAEEKVRAIFREPIRIAKALEIKLKDSISRFLTDRDRKRQEEQRRLEDAARKERARLEAQAAEERAKAEAEARKLTEKAAAERTKGNEGKAAAFESRATSALENGQARATETEAISQVVTAPTVAAAPKLAGLSGRKVWKGKVIDSAAVFAFLGTEAGAPYRTICEFSDAQLNRFAGSLHENMSKVIAGTHAEEVNELAKRRTA